MKLETQESPQDQEHPLDCPLLKEMCFPGDLLHLVWWPDAETEEPSPCSLKHRKNIQVIPDLSLFLPFFHHISLHIRTFSNKPGSEQIGFCAPSLLRVKSFRFCSPTMHCSRWFMLSKRLLWSCRCFSLYSAPWRYKRPKSTEQKVNTQLSDCDLHCLKKLGISKNYFIKVIYTFSF